LLPSQVGRTSFLLEIESRSFDPEDLLNLSEEKTGDDLAARDPNLFIPIRWTSGRPLDVHSDDFPGCERLPATWSRIKNGGDIESKGPMLPSF
jgi:hypothetical protein